ncbi:MAG: thioredoxin family protein [Candidatus Obscuribacterales bacterium]|nr:thioredoxin family protein [Candidatus Obscuribacterales bacterium]
MIRKCVDSSIIAASFFLVAMPLAIAASTAQEAMAEYNSGHYPAALSQFVALEKQYPTNAMVHYYTGLCRQAMGQISEARTEYQWVSSHDQGKLKQYATSGLANLDKLGSHSDSPASADSAGAADTTKGTASAKAGSKADSDGPDLSNLDPNMSPKVQQALEMAKKAGVRIGKDGKVASAKDTATPAPVAAAGAGSAAAATAAGAATTAPKVVKKSKVKKILEFCVANDRSCINFEDTFNSTQKQFNDIQFVKMNCDDGANATTAAKYNVSAYPTLVYLDDKDKVLGNELGAPNGDAFAEKIKSLNDAR